MSAPAKCVIYVRVSSDDQVRGTSLQSQEDICRAYAARQGWTVDCVFRDEGESAKTADRPQFQALLRYATVKANGIAVALAYKIDRFARNSDDYTFFKCGLAASGVTISSATEPEADGPAGKMLRTMLSAIAQFDNDVRAERTREAMRRMAEAGYWLHQAPKGYVTRRVEGKPVIEPDPLTAPHIATVFREIAAGRWSVSTALDHLAAQGVTGRRGLALSRQTLHEILRNPVYAGFTWRAGVAIEGRWVALVDRATWSACQGMLGVDAGPAGQKKRHRDEFPLRGLIRCECGAIWTSSFSRGRSGRYAYYHCPDACHGARIRIEVAHADFEHVLNEIGSLYAADMDAIALMCRRKLARAREQLEAGRVAAAAQLEALETQRDQVARRALMVPAAAGRD